MVNLPIHHIGIATKSIAEEFEYFKQLGFSMQDSFIDTKQGVRGVFVVPNNPALPLYRFELLENLNENGILDSYLKNRIKMYHIAFETKDIESSLKELMNVYENAIDTMSLYHKTGQQFDRESLCEKSIDDRESRKACDAKLLESLNVAINQESTNTNDISQSCLQQDSAIDSKSHIHFMNDSIKQDSKYLQSYILKNTNGGGGSMPLTDVMSPLNFCCDNTSFYCDSVRDRVSRNLHVHQDLSNDSSQILELQFKHAASHESSDNRNLACIKNERNIMLENQQIRSKHNDMKKLKPRLIVPIMENSYFAKLCFIMMPNRLLIELVELKNVQ